MRTALFLLTAAIALLLTSCNMGGTVGRIGGDLKDEAAIVGAAEMETTVAIHKERRVYGVELQWEDWGFGLGMWPLLPSKRIKEIATGATPIPQK